MIASILIIVASAALFLYWFRYTCLLLIGQGSAEYALKVASTIRLSFPGVRAALETHPQRQALDCLHASLANDHQILTSLLGEVGAVSIERRILSIYYDVMQTWYKVTRLSPDLLGARNALSEMSSVLSYFASEIGESAVA